MKKRIAALLCALLFCLPAVSGYAFGAEKHWEDMQKILFGKVILNDNNKNKFSKEETNIQILQYACQICIDQFSSNTNACQDSLKELRSHVPGLPKDINKLMLYASGVNHRKFTHRGWAYDYSGCENGNRDWAPVWEQRKRLLRLSVEKAFNFNGLPSIIDAVTGGYTEQGEAFSRLLYCIHILGDHIEYENGEGSLNDQLLPIIAPHDKSSVVQEIREILPELLPTTKYSELERKLDEYEKKYQSGQETAKGLKKLLKNNLPTLLQNEPYFQKAFPSQTP